MAGIVIDRLETVEIEEHQRVLQSFFSGVGNSGLQALFKTGAIGQRGQGIVGRAVTQLLHQFARGRDILQYHHRAHDVAVDRFQW
ncbi:hypothetical protein D3C76_1672410 [compost metagenome]